MGTSEIVGGAVASDPRVAKVYGLYEATQDTGEKAAAKLALLRLGYYVDRAGVLWERNKVPEWVMEGEPNVK